MTQVLPSLSASRSPWPSALKSASGVVPASGMTCLPPESESVRVNDADMVPVCLGVKPTPIEHDPFAPAMQLLAALKSDACDPESDVEMVVLEL